MIPLPSRDPGDIASAARCFSSCVPGVGQLALRTYLLTQVANIATPPCITPASPVIAVLPGLTTNTSITVAWNFAGNQGSLVNGYEVFWGTATGVYTNNSGRLPPGPVGSIRSYMISGLTAGTAYFIVVVALTTIAGCQSANSNEVSATTSGASTNGLLNGLSSYWNFGDGLDKEDGNNLAFNGGVFGPSAGTPANLVLESGNTFSGGTGTWCRCNPAANLEGGAGVSLSFQIWFNAAGAGDANAVLISRFASLANVHWTFSAQWGAAGAGASNLQVFVENTALNSLVSVSVGNPANNAWHHLCGGYDDGAGVVWAQLDGGARVTTPQTGISGENYSQFVVKQNAAAVQDGGASQGMNGTVAAASIWKRALSTTDVTNLYNAGNALNFSQFQT